MVLASYAGFAWIESARGRQVYPPGFLGTFFSSCLFLSVATLGAALTLALRNRKTLAGGEEPQRAEERATKWLTPGVTLLLLCGALLFTAMAVNHWRLQGRLALLPSYDDVGYFADALNRLYAFYDAGVPGLLKQYWQGPPHSPTSTLLAAMGYVILGTEDWAPAAMNFLLVFGVLLFVRSRTRDLKAAWAVPVYLFAMTWPLVFLSVVHCATEYAWSLSLAIAGWLAVERPLTRRSPRSQFGLGILFGLSFLAKPPSFPVTAFVLAAALSLIIAIEFAQGGLAGLWRRVAAPLARLVAGCAALCLPHYLLAYKGIWAYIATNALGPRQDLWKYRGSPAQQLFFYVTGNGGSYEMGGMLQLWGALAVVAFGCALVLRKRDVVMPAAAAAALFLFGNAVVSVTSYKNIHLGMVVPATFLVTGIVMMAGVLAEAQKTAERRWALLMRLACVGIAAVALAQYRPVPMKELLGCVMRDYPRQGADFIREAERRKLVLSRIMAQVWKDPRQKVTIGFVRADLYNNAAVYQFQFRKNRTKQVECIDTSSYQQDNERFRREIEAADYLFYLSGGSDDDKPLLEFLKTQATWRVVERIDDPLGGGASLLLGKSSDWRSVALGTKDVAGFSGVEGPYAPATYQVRWGLGPRSLVNFSLERTMGLVLQAEATAFAAGQNVAILLDGRPISSVTVSPGADFNSLRIPFEAGPGAHKLEFAYSNWDRRADHRPLAVLFRKLALSER
jgi:hypothetical protein